MFYMEVGQVWTQVRNAGKYQQHLDLLAVGQVDLFEDGVEVRGGLAVVVFIEKDGRASELDAQLLHALTVIHRQEKTLSAASRPRRHHH